MFSLTLLTRSVKSDMFVDNNNHKGGLKTLNIPSVFRNQLSNLKMFL